MFSAMAKTVVAGAALSLALSALAPAAAHAAPQKAPLVMTEGEAAPAAEGGGKVWFAFMWPDNLKPQLEEKKMLLTIVGLLPYGAVWGPIALLGQGFDLEWALPSLVWHIVGNVIWVVPYIGWTLGALVWLGMNWIATQTMFANLNRPEIQVGGGEAPVK
ncbi:MAG: hypothetical protein HY904_25385 [Deltaproteobacteria bacterium]|nr:hypothetical protein [Deltaproteobacteria bacterium]